MCCVGDVVRLHRADMDHYRGAAQLKVRSGRRGNNTSMVVWHALAGTVAGTQMPGSARQVAPRFKAPRCAARR